ncbi:MAG: hypothetical protein NC084_10205 [Bacteroides sp.]|nr:hypothetical protein [Eubacterium sp.]MCM1419174.1 hypothetical protein [Roseburia sp.]MCM1463071.1 hypothetical protein [Bacteroides sp.]
MGDIREKTWEFSGGRRELSIYPRPIRGACARSAPPREVSPEQARRWHEAAERRKLARKIEANFNEDDYFLTLTYAKEPTDRRAAENDLSKFICRTRNFLRSRGESLSYIKTTGTGEKNGRFHHHVVLSGNVSRAELERLWSLGDIDVEYIGRDEDGTFSDLAGYIMKQGKDRPKGKPAYRGSRNLKIPPEKVSDDSITVRAFRRLAHAWTGDGETGLKRELSRLYPDGTVVSAHAIRNPVTGALSFRAFLKCSSRAERRSFEAIRPSERMPFRRSAAYRDPLIPSPRSLVMRD